MKKIISVFLILCCIGISGCTKQNNISSEEGKVNSNQVTATNSKSDETSNYAEPAKYIKNLLPEKNIKVDVMGITMQEDIQQKLSVITDKFKKSAEKNYEWYSGYINKYKGQQMPYHKNFGISEDEYNLILTANNYMKLSKIGDGSMTINKKDTNIITLSDIVNLDFLKGIEIDLLKNEIKTNKGTLKYNDKVVASDNQKVTGKWSGHTWTLEVGDITKLNDKNIDKSTKAGFYSISVGTLEETGKAIIYYKENFIENGNVEKSEEIIEYRVQ